MNTSPNTEARRTRVRCAIYTRKSTDAGLDQDFNSLDAQREAAVAYIASQRHDGWERVPANYDDGGYSGATLDRPALERLLKDIERGAIDCVVVHRVDRLSRSLLDFTRVLETFEKHKVAFVSVTQQFNTASSMGRLVLNVLLSFAQFEREMISERTRDKMAAARRKGKWVGGRPALGYDVDPRGASLIVNEAEATLVRSIFAMYLEERSLLRVAELLNGRGERMKSWTTRKGHRCEGGLWDKTAVRRLLTNRVYLGQVEYEGAVYAGEHAAILDQALFDRVQRCLLEGRDPRGPRGENRHGFLLRGLIKCAACGSVMTSSFAVASGKHHRYYRCSVTSRRGANACPVRSIPAGTIEQFVVERIREMSKHPELVLRTLASANGERARIAESFEEEEGRVRSELARCRDDANRLFSSMSTDETSGGKLAAERLAELEKRAEQLEHRLAELKEQRALATHGEIKEEDLRGVLLAFDPVWNALVLREQTRIINQLIERITYDGRTGKLSLTFHPAGVALLANEARGKDAA